MKSLKFDPTPYIVVYHDETNSHYAIKKELAPSFPWKDLPDDALAECIKIGDSGILMSEEPNTYLLPIKELKEVWIRY